MPEKRRFPSTQINLLPETLADRKRRTIPTTSFGNCQGLQVWSFIEMQILSHPYAKWIAGKVGWGLLAAAIAVAQWDEYLVSLLLFLGGCVILFLKTYHWQTESRATKVLLLIACVVAVIASVPLTIAKKGDKPWSDGWYRLTHRQLAQHESVNSEPVVRIWPAELILQLLPVSDGDTPTHISIRANDPFTVQIFNRGAGAAEKVSLMLTPSGTCKFTKASEDFYLSHSGDYAHNDPQRITSIQRLTTITGKFSVECPKGDQLFRLTLYYECVTCPNDNQWGSPVIVVIKQ